MKSLVEQNFGNSNNNKTQGNIFNIQRFSLHDGPGIRTVVFLKGCTLRCIWCANPESIAAQNQTFFNQKHCEQAPCDAPCKGQQIRYNSTMISIDGRLETLNWVSEEQCPNSALRNIGESCTVEQVVSRVMADELYFRTSGGGVTLSGGEMAMQPEFSRALLLAFRNNNIHTAIETAGNVYWEAFWQACEYSNLILFDFKTLNTEEHIKHVGKSNAVLLQNLLHLLKKDIPLRIRIPVIPEANDTPERADEMMRFLYEHTQDSSSFTGIDLLPYHRFGIGKYELLGEPYRYGKMYPNAKEANIKVLEEAAKRYNLNFTTLSYCIA